MRKMFARINKYAQVKQGSGEGEGMSCSSKFRSMFERNTVMPLDANGSYWWLFEVWNHEGPSNDRAVQKKLRAFPRQSYSCALAVKFNVPGYLKTLCSVFNADYHGIYRGTKIKRDHMLHSSGRSTISHFFMWRHAKNMVNARGYLRVTQHMKMMH